MQVQLLNTLGTVADSIVTADTEELTEWAKQVYRESYSFLYFDENFRAWEISCMEIYPQDISIGTFQFIRR